MPSVSTLAAIDICNMAVSNIGISPTMQSISPPDQTVQAQTCAFWYPKVRDQLLQGAPWNFADTNELLAQEPVNANVDVVAMPGWGYSYSYPNDVLQPLAVTTLAGQRLGPVFWSSWWSTIPQIGFPFPKIPFKVVQSVANPGQLAIVCDVLAVAGNPLFLFYIQAVTNTAMFDPLFCDALSWALAFSIGPSLRADPQKVQMAGAMAASKRLQALAQHLNAAQQDPERDSPSVLARW